MCQERGTWPPEVWQDKLHHGGDRSGEHPPDTVYPEGSQHAGAPGTPAPGWVWAGLSLGWQVKAACTNSASRKDTALH